MGHIVFNKLLALMEEKGVTIYRIRKGKSITTDSIAALCEVLNCQPGDIMEYISEQSQPQKGV